MTDADFNAWLADPNGLRTILFEVVANSGGADVTRYIATRGFVTLPTDTPPNTPYMGVVKGGIQFHASISLDGGSDISYGDVELDNSDGALDAWLDDVWMNKTCRAYIGDARWSRGDFRLIFDGVLAGVNAVDRVTFNLLLRDKLQRLDVPISEAKVGGNGAGAQNLLPVCLGECHNITPSLIDSALLKYQWHVGTSERLIEVRDAGVPLRNGVDVIVSEGTSTFVLKSQPYGDVTASVQGDRSAGYLNTVAQLVSHVVRDFGTEPQLRFTTNDLDSASITAFDQRNPQPVGLYASDRATVREVVDALAASVGARFTLGFDGKARLVKIQLPPTTTPLTITASEMVADSLQITDRLPVSASVKIAFCKNWTVQTGLTGLIPEEHKMLFGQEWLYASSSDPVVAAAYGLYEEAAEEQTLLLRRIDATAEAGRRLQLRSVPRTIYEFTGFAELMFLQLGAAVKLQHWRYGLAAGKVGQVVSLDVDWINSRVRVGVLI